MKTALISGISGQDGSYLANLLLEKGYRVVGTSRDAQATSFGNLHRLGISDRIELRSMVPTDFESALQILDAVRPDEVYNLAGQSSVSLSFEKPVETVESIIQGTMNLLESIRVLGRHVKLFNASSSDCFGDTETFAADEETPFRPRSPYGVAKAAAHWAVANYRQAYGLHAANGILFNHESPLRPNRYVTKKIIAGVCRIKAGTQRKLELGTLTIERDWGWAPEYVEAMWRILQKEDAEDFVIATGVTSSLQQFVEAAFSQLDLDWRDHLQVGATPGRPTDIFHSRGNPAKARVKLGWQARFTMRDVVRMMLEAESSVLKSAAAS
jgi:GDPmannose 4,6-dehydratase